MPRDPISYCEKVHLAAALRRATGQSAGTSAERDSARFLSLVWARDALLEARLAEAVHYLSQAQVPLNWRQMLADLSVWYEPDQPAQTRWMETYFKSERA